MMSPLIRSVALRGWMVAVGVFAGGAGFAQPASSTTSRPELACLRYTNNTFLSDDSVNSKLSTRHDFLPLPCTENVAPASVDASKDPKAGAAAGGLNAMFSATRTPIDRLQNGFDLYSWLTFLALNSPPAADQKATTFGAADAKTAWESSFAPLDQVMSFREDKENFHLKSDSQAENLPQKCKDIAQNMAVKPTLFVNVDDVAFDQPFKTGPLIDQNGNYSLNTIFVNQTMRNYIVQNHLTTYRDQQSFKDTVDFPVGVADDKNPILGSMMIKASWRVLTKADDATEFHTVKAYLYFPPSASAPSSEKCETSTLGLVGFHVVHKTQNRHQWIWTTFEHVRNVPSIEDLKEPCKLQTSYFFNDARRPSTCPAGGTPAATAPGERRNVPPDQPWDPLHPSAHKSQIVRAQDISADTRLINAAAQRFLGAANVWSHYQLISTQWPADFGCASEGGGVKTNQQADPNCAPAPEFLPNSTLETYIQHDIGSSGGVPQATSSCIACHNNAVGYLKVDFGDRRSLDHTGFRSPAERECLSKSPTQACSTASDFTFVLEQVCAPMADLSTGKPNNDVCKRDH